MRINRLFSNFRHQVFWPPFLLLLAALVYSLADAEGFLETTSRINDLIISRFGWLFSITTGLMLLCCLVICFHPLGKHKIGGEHAEPFLSKWRWFSIVLCTTIATGIIFWGTAEPLFHFSSPPAFSETPALSEKAAQEALSYMYLHWTFTPYAIYCIPALMFAIAFYNRKRSFSLESTLFPWQKATPKGKLGVLIDGICLYALVAGMAASLGAGILTLSGGIHNLTGYQSPWLLLFIALLIVGCFTLSAISGLMKGIRVLSDINARIFLILALFLLFFGPTKSILSQWGQALVIYFKSLPEMTVVSVLYPNDDWPKSWTTFNWANWMAWAPITALFLGRLAKGYTIRQFMLFNWVLPSLFGMLWMSIFSGIALHFQLSKKADLLGLLTSLGPESVIYGIFDALPWSDLLALIFLFTAFLSYVTAADSNTEAMGGISSTGISPQAPSAPVFIKIVWGTTIGLVAYIMVSMAGIEGIKMLSNLGGLPALFLLLAITLGCIFWLLKHKKK
ncbi:BCCT family transporter [Roseivirga sp. UBA1976]|uniref:BCCT family transporter n=1 Tax=Roseivirga sp. UBA1976 TaxID=1947386 RepID=UPI00257AA281|nr:BCCT family transporter [Roseivirga sp. UBA1976]MEC7756091.1 BCCT family transporter [Bacteroidota bacterium]